MSQQINDDFTEDSFWEKVKTFAIKAGVKVIYASLLLFYCLKDKNIPAWTKTVIIGALTYFISPLDAIPDAVPFAGFTDDLGALVAALVVVAAYIDEGIKQKSRAKLYDWFGRDTLEDIKEIDSKFGTK